MNQESQTGNELLVLYTVADIQKIFKCGKNQAYALVHSSGFPKIKFNNKFLVPKDKLEKWINTYTGKEFTYSYIY